MSLRVWKYPVPLQDDVFALDLPLPAQVLSVQLQHGEPYLWALVDPDMQTKKRRWLEWVGTGHANLSSDDPDKLRHVATVQTGMFVFHLFEVLL